MIDIENRTDSDRGAFLTHLRGGGLPSAPRLEVLVAWIATLALLGLLYIAPTLMAWQARVTAAVHAALQGGRVW